MKRWAGAVSAALAVLLVLTAAAGAQSRLGENYLELADEFRNLANFKKAGEFVDKAVDELTRQPGDPAMLARAYYLRAMIHISQNAAQDLVVQDLVQALKAAPEAEVPKAFAGHPTIRKSLAKAREQITADRQVRRQEARIIFKKAQLLFLDQKYCEAEKLLKPALDDCEDPELATKYVQVSARRCEAQAPPPDTGPTSKSKTVGLFPVSCRCPGRADSVCSAIDREKLAAALSGILPQIGFVTVDDQRAEHYRRQYKFDHYGEFAVRKGFLYVDKPTLQKPIPDTKFGGLTPWKIEALRHFAREERLAYCLFIDLKCQDDGGLVRIHFIVNLYDADNPEDPVIARYSTNLSESKLTTAVIQTVKAELRNFF